MTRFDSTGNLVFDEVNTPRVNSIALAKTRAVNPQGTLFTLNTSFRAETATATSYDLLLSQYDPNLDLRNTTRLGTFTLPSGQADKSTWELVQAYADGSLLLSGTTNGTLTIGANTFTGSTAQPARFLTLLNSTLAQVTAPTAAVCQGTSATLKARYKGYLTQAPVVQLADAKGSFAQPALSQSVPLSLSALTDTTLASLSLPLPATLAAGTYRLRTLVGGLVSAETSLSITATPTTPSVSQQAGEAVATATGQTFQWYDAQRSPIAGATAARFRPQTTGNYYVAATANGCSSALSAPLAFVVRNVVQLVAPTTTACTGTTLSVGGRYQGYFSQRPLVQLSDLSGSFSAVQASASVPLALSATTTDTVGVSTPLLLPAGLAGGIYKLQATSAAPQVTGVPVSLSVVATPAAPSVSQQGDELVSSATGGSFQWYDAQRSPIAGATSARFRPQTAGTYSVVNTVGGCASLNSAGAVYVITGLEPVVDVLIYPNPTAASLHVYWPGAGSRARIRLVDGQGRILQETDRRGDVTEVPTQGLANGLIVVQLEAEGQATRAYKVLIQR